MIGARFRSAFCLIRDYVTVLPPGAWSPTDWAARKGRGVTRRTSERQEVAAVLGVGVSVEATAPAETSASRSSSNSRAGACPHNYLPQLLSEQRTLVRIQTRTIIIFFLRRRQLFCLGGRAGVFASHVRTSWPLRASRCRSNRLFFSFLPPPAAPRSRRTSWEPTRAG